MTITEERTTRQRHIHPMSAPAQPSRNQSAFRSNGIVVRGAMGPRFTEILTPAALEFLTELDRRFGWRRVEILDARRIRQAEIDSGSDLDFLPSTTGIRTDPNWTVAAPGPGLRDRRCELTGPPTRKMTVSALNSGAQVWMADFEDTNSPTWFNIIDGQINVLDAIRRQIDGTDEQGQRCQIGENTPTIMVRPRGWHLCEKHLILDGHSVPAAFVDFALYFFHNAAELIERGSGPYFYLPKMQSHTEARLWNDVFVWAQEELGIPQGTIRATCLIETLPAAFEMTEILYELRDHSAGLAAGRRDYLFSMIKTMGSRPTHVLPDRSDVTMTKPFMQSYTDLLVQTCHARGAHAIGGMAALMPARNGETATAVALSQTRQDKAREAANGFDGSWVAHPRLVDTCLTTFDNTLGERPHQLDQRRQDVSITASKLLDVTGVGGSITIEGIRINIRTSLHYLAAWVDGRGAVAIDQLMEDAATVEISRMQLWQWIKHGASTDEGIKITQGVVNRYLDEEIYKLERSTDRSGRSRLAAARDILVNCCQLEDSTDDDSPVPSFFTCYAYPRHLVQRA